MSKKLYARILAAALILQLAACSKSDNLASGTTGGAGNLLIPLKYMLDINASFHSFDTLMKKSGYYDRLTGDSSYTLLIPDEDAFAYAHINVDSLLQLPIDSLRQFVGYHILAGVISTAIVPQSITNEKTTLSGQIAYFSKQLDVSGITLDPKQMHINGTGLRKTDVMAVDGIVQVLKSPLRPPVSNLRSYLLSRPEYSLWVAGLRKFNLLDQLALAGPFTLMVPTNDVLTRYNLTQDRINSDTFDTKHYQPFLFTAGILPARIFNTDFGDAPIANNGLTYTRYGTIQYGSNYDGSMGIFVQNYNYPSYFSHPDPAWNNQIGARITTYMYDQQPAINGVIHRINDIEVYPDSVYIQQ